MTEWLQSGKPLHLMKDNPNQTCTICGGMWGARLNSPDLRQDKNLSSKLVRGVIFFFLKPLCTLPQRPQSMRGDIHFLKAIKRVYKKTLLIVESDRSGFWRFWTQKLTNFETHFWTWDLCHVGSVS